ncbi:D-2-hydroxyacid dehydrogenase [Mesobacillus foraminis]|uniref:D-2-hydroxyacid dehydrogenase n=1 Tax=Mesobacillus foraminis TaxID=279826 RepID=UPI000EF4F001|nr:D-2-hydroxyacid dehydrogenase [Mesobacillus foraminis]
MPKRKLIITQNLEQKQINTIEQIIPSWEIITGKEPSNWQEHLNDAEIIVGWKKEIASSLDDCSCLRWIQSWSAGVNSLPLERLESRNILVTSANGVHAYPISETIFAMMLGFTRKINTYVKNQLEKKWDHSGLKHEIHGKTIGILGVGAIGKETARIAKAFRMNVLGVRHSGKPEEYVDKMYTPGQLNEILPLCDYVVVTLPLTKETHHLFGREQFSRMKPSAFIINIGRGAIIDESELFLALSGGKIAGAGLDVFEEEPLGGDSPLWDMDNVIITPHTAGSTEYYTKRVIEDIFMPNLKMYLKGESPAINLVDYRKGY